jgi:hypothetical protein
MHSKQCGERVALSVLPLSALKADAISSTVSSKHIHILINEELLVNLIDSCAVVFALIGVTLAVKFKYL